MIENPQPYWLPFLLLALPGLGFAACGLNAVLFPRHERPLCTIPAIGLVLGLLPTHALALVTGSLSLGLAAAWSAIGAVGYAWLAGHWRDFRGGLSLMHPEWIRRLGIAALATVPILCPAILANFHDASGFNGHEAIIAHLQNGTYPPRYLYEPSLPLRYHYGFDLLGAIVTGLLRLRLDQAIGLLTVALWPCTFLLLWRLGDHVGGRGAGIFAALVVCFADGWGMLAKLHDPRGTNPPFIDYYFQHPWSLGVPLFCLAMLLRAALPGLGNRALGFAFLTCTLVLLSLAQAALFVTAAVALSLVEGLKLLRTRGGDGVAMSLVLVASVLGAKLVGGFFAAGPYPPSGGILNTPVVLHDFPDAEAVLAQIEWNVTSFGILLAAGTAGLLRARQDKAVLLALAVLSLLVVNALRYRYSWDIVKFGTVGFIVLAIGTGIALRDLAAWAERPHRKLVFAALFLAVAGLGFMDPLLEVASAYATAERQPFSRQMIRPYASLAYPVDRDDARAVNFLRKHMGPTEIMYRGRDKAEPYAIWGGLPTQASVYAESRRDDPYGLGERKFANRVALETISVDWFDRLSAEHVAWLVADAGDAGINAALDSAQGRRWAALAAHYGAVRVYRLGNIASPGNGTALSGR